MAKLNQIIAVVSGKKTKTQELLTATYQKVQKPELFQGISRVYRPNTEDGETKPPETKLVQYNVNEAINEFCSALTDLVDVVFTQDKANCEAKADVVVENTTVAKDVPVSHLLFLEKQLVDVRTFVNKLPVLDPSENWKFDSNKNCYSTDVSKTNATKKVYKNHEKAPATDKHPAQVEVYTEDVKVGEWDTTKFSGAISAKTKKEILGRVDRLADAIKFAREQANSMEVTQQKLGKDLLKFVFNQ